MTVLKTSMRNFFAHKGRMALSAVAVLLSVAFVCGTLVFTDTMNTTFDKLFSVTSADVTVSPKTAESDETSQNGVPESMPASVLAKTQQAEGVKSAEGAVSLEGLKVLEIPWMTIGGVFAGSALVGLFAALVPAFRAGRMNVLNAIATD